MTKYFFFLLFIIVARCIYEIHETKPKRFLIIPKAMLQTTIKINERNNRKKKDKKIKKKNVVM